MEEQIAAYIQKIGPGEKRAEWHQRSLKRALEEWKESDPGTYEEVIKQRAFGGAVGYHIYPDGVGQYGYDTNYHFEPNLDAHFLEDVENPGSICERVYEIWVRELQEVITEDQESTTLTPKELACYYANRNPMLDEARAADALGIAVGTYRGKVGRVKEKLEAAKNTLSITEPADVESEEEWRRKEYAARPAILVRVDEDRLPIDAVHHVEGMDIDDVPLDVLLEE